MANSTPTLTGLDTPFTFLENTVNVGPQVINADVTFADPDNNFNGATLTVAGLLAEDTVAIRRQGFGAGEIGFFDGQVTYGGDLIGTATGGAGATLTVTFTGGATSEAVDALIQNLTYANSSNTPTASRTLKLKITDTAGAAAIAPLAFSTGSANPLDGFDVGNNSTPAFADLDGDGDLDAIVGEEDGTLNYFLNSDTATIPQFTVITGGANPFNGFDTGDASTPTFGDLDGDGVLDLVVGKIDGTLAFFENTGTATAPAFTERTGGANPFNGIDMGSIASPVLADLDADGDLDAVVGMDDGTLHYLRNGGSATASAFVELTGANNPFNGVNLGSDAMPSLGDLDGDGDLDALVGEEDGILNYFENIGTATAATFVLRATDAFGIDVEFLSAPTLADLDGDGDLDAIVGEGDGVLNLVRNTTPQAATPDFAEQTGAANPFNGFNAGTFSTPSFADLDGDGDLDALVGNSSGTLKYFKNTGSATAPAYTEQIGGANPFDGFDLGSNSAPSFADLDGDGDLDAIVGEFDGDLSYFRNGGTATTPGFTLLVGGSNPLNGVDVGDSSTPSFADLDGDGDLDALVANSNGTLKYFKNTGVATAPAFTEQAGAANPFNGIDVGTFSRPNFADLDGDGDLDLTVGENDGTLHYFKNTGSATAPAFTTQTGAANPFNGIDVGFFSRPSFADLDGDGDHDAIVGDNNSGTLHYFKNTGAGFELVVNVTAQNDAPAIISNGGGATATVSIAENTTAVTTVAASDADSGPLTYSIAGGADAARFQINPSTGVLAFIAAPDFEAPSDADQDNSYVVQVSASDGSLTDTQTITVSVTDVNDTIQLSPGDDSYTAPAGNAVINGLGGIDTATFGFKLVEATVSHVGNTVVIDGPSSRTVLTGFERFAFTDGTVNNNDGNALVDDLFYFSRSHDVWNAQLDADVHYSVVGWQEGRDPSAFFDTSFYLAINPDVKGAGINPLDHFHQSSWREGRLPSVAFDPAAYLAANPDVKAASVDPLEHFLAAGAPEGRQPIAATELLAANGFDFIFYLANNPDVAAAGIDPFRHFQTTGWTEGRNPNAHFDTAGYLAAYSDVQGAGVNPVDHYNVFGWKEGRDPSAGFDTTDYLAANPDVAAAKVNPLSHFLDLGRHEGRVAFNDGLFDG
jgi:hypothetical protein